MKKAGFPLLSQLLDHDSDVDPAITKKGVKNEAI